ncbi:unnamed protein product [Prunus armeniaca]|uniref:Uncharacterized protein n=1 Tax=Prunus armeniaca TaxID=36596 RepID=A0A6J5V2J3_PRUAR|nr:unnamed protein product [Prunus armeniaca]
MKPHITKCKLPQSVTGLALNFFQAVSRKEIKQEPAAGATEFKRLLHLLHIFFFCMESHITHGWSFPSPSHFIADMLYNSSYRHRVSDYFFQHSKRNTTWCYELLVRWGSFAVGDGPSFEFNKRLFLLKWGSVLVNQKNK